MGDPFHQAAITHEHIGVVIDDREFRAVIMRRQGPLGNGHAHGIGQSLTQRAGGGFHAGRVAVFRVARGFRV